MRPNAPLQQVLHTPAVAPVMLLVTLPSRSSFSLPPPPPLTGAPDSGGRIAHDFVHNAKPLFLFPLPPLTAAPDSGGRNAHDFFHNAKPLFLFPLPPLTGAPDSGGRIAWLYAALHCDRRRDVAAAGCSAV
eukprot:360270-Chlamydomonas_euryale.AAC.2